MPIHKHPIPQRAALLVLGALTAPGLFGQVVEDDCRNPFMITDGATPFSTFGATTDGPSPCAEQGSDIWLLYEPTVVGSVSFSTCTPALTFDSVLAAHWPTVPSDPDPNACILVTITCNDDAPDTACSSGGSALRVRSRIGSRPVLVQVGGKDGQQGAGEIVVSSCLGDFDADGVVALPDLSLMLSEFGPNCGAFPCASDLEGDGDVDLTDLAVLLSRFGTECP